MSATLVTPKTASGGEIIRELINSSDGQGLHFDGVAGRIDVASPPDLGTKFSFEFVLKADSFGSSNLYFVDFGNGGRFIFGAHSSTSYNWAIFDNTSWNSFGVKVSDDLEVHHLVVTVDGTAAVLYDNGNQVGTTTISAGHGIDSCSDLFIGSAYSSAVNLFNGSLYRTRFYNKALTQAEVDTAYQRADVPFESQYGNQTSLVDANASTFVGTSTYGWVKYSNNGLTNTGNELVITYVDHANGAYDYLKDSTDLTTNLIVGKKYKLQIDAKYAGGSAGVIVQVYDGAAYVDGSALTTSMTTQYIEFTAQHATNAFVRLSGLGSSNVVTLDNFYVYRCGAVADYDLAFANPTQSLMVQDRAGVADGTATAGVSQTQKIPQLNATAISVSAATARTPSDGEIVADTVSVSATGHDAAKITITNTASSNSRLLLNSGHGNWSVCNSSTVGDALEFRDESAAATRMLIDSAGETKITRTGDEPCLELATDNAGCKLLFARGGDPTAYIRMYEDGSTGSGSLRFATGTSATPVERLKIDTAGLVTVDGGDLKLKAPAGNQTDAELLFESPNNSSFGSTFAIDSKILSTANQTDNAYGSRLKFFTNNNSNTLTERMSIDSAGAVKIVGTLRADVLNNQANTANIIYRSGSSTIVGSNAKALVVFDAGNVALNSGNVAVGAGSDIGGSGVTTFDAAERIEMRAAGAESPQFLASCYSATSSRCASIAFQKSHTNTGGVLDATVADENLGRILFKGVSSGDGARDSAEITAVCDGGPDGSDQPAKLLFKTSSLSSTLATRMAIRYDGYVQLNGSGDVFSAIQNTNSLSMANDATTTFEVPSGVFSIYDTGGYGALFFADYSESSVTKIAGSSHFTAGGTGAIRVTSATNDSTVTVENKQGGTRTIKVMLVTN